MVTTMPVLRIALMMIIVLFVSIFGPDFYWKANKHENNKTNVNFSPIKKGFLFTHSDVRGSSYSDAQGKFYTRDEFEALMPFLNFRQLMLAGKLPQSIDEIPITPKEINLNNFTQRIAPALIQAKPLQLFPLMESASDRLRLELPPDFFRIGRRMEFITALTNEVNEEKSVVFTKALVAEGFTFPAKSIYGNPSTKKPFDEGYFVVDGKDRVFHIKMVKGAPYCKDTGISPDLHIVSIIPMEIELREFYAVFITQNNEVYFISTDHYQLIRLPVENYNHEENTLTIKGDLFYRLITINAENGYHATVTDRKYAVIDRTSAAWPGRETTISGAAASYLFPFTVSIEKETTPYIQFYFKHSGVASVPLLLASLLFSIYYMRKKNVPVRPAMMYCTAVVLTGLYGIIALLAIKDYDDDPAQKK